VSTPPTNRLLQATHTCHKASALLLARMRLFHTPREGRDQVRLLASSPLFFSRAQKWERRFRIQSPLGICLYRPLVRLRRPRRTVSRSTSLPGDLSAWRLHTTCVTNSICLPWLAHLADLRPSRNSVLGRNSIQTKVPVGPRLRRCLLLIVRAIPLRHPSARACTRPGRPSLLRTSTGANVVFLSFFFACLYSA
jgi:hypothetical protein